MFIITEDLENIINTDYVAKISTGGPEKRGLFATMATGERVLISECSRFQDEIMEIYHRLLESREVVAFPPSRRMEREMAEEQKRG